MATETTETPPSSSSSSSSSLACCRHLPAIPGWLYLAAAVGLFSLKVSIFKLLQATDPATFNTCNILCASNTIGLLSSLFFLRKDLSVESVKSIPRHTVLWMCLGAVLSSIIGPLFFNLGLESTDVATVSILQRSQSVFILLAGPIVSKCKKFPVRWNVANGLLTTVGILLAIVSPLLFFRQTSISLSSGEFYILLSAVSYTCSLLITKDFLGKVPLWVLTVFRLLVGTGSFHIIAVARGTDNWIALWTIKLWLNMLYYGVFFVTVPQQAFLQSLNLCSRAVISSGTNVGFPLQIGLAMLIFQTVPSPSILIGSAFILISIGSAIAKENSGGGAEDDGTRKDALNESLIGVDTYTELSEEGGNEEGEIE